MLSSSFLFASLIWGSIGVGFLIYGMRQKSVVPTAGGLLMIVASYFANSALSMSLICLALGIGIYLLIRQGY
jgi:hypothetical protein